eukprot:g3470.t1
MRSSFSSKVGSVAWRSTLANSLREKVSQVFESRHHVIRNAETKPIETKYSLGHEIARGRYGIVYRAEDVECGTPVAVKRIMKNKIKKSQQKRILQSEIDAIRDLDHPNCMSFISTFESRRNLDIVSELLSGGELFDTIVAEHSFSEAVACRIAHQILKGLEYMHDRDLIHRDIKPENARFRCSSKGLDSELVLIDFGMTTRIKKGETKKEHVGSVSYAAPEVLLGEPHERSIDVYSTGIILYVMLSGYLPFDDMDIVNIRKEIHKGKRVIDLKGSDFVHLSQDVKDLIQWMTDPNPMKRPSVRECLEHPWMTSSAARQTDPLPREVLESLNRFHRADRLKRAALSVIAEKMSPTEIKGFEYQFKELDKDRDGTVSLEELSSVIDRDAKAMLDVIDVDHDGRITLTEFVAAAMRESQFMQEEKLMSAFKEFDLDGSGVISKEELRIGLAKYGKLHATENIDVYIDDVLKSADRNNDGVIDYEEFVIMLSDTIKDNIDK